MGHYVTAYCSAHGEVDMDDSLAFCPDCYEVTPKGALTEARAEIERQKRLGKIIADDYEMELATNRVRIAELEADVEWVARVGIGQFINEENVLFTMTTPTIFMSHNGTPADILRAVREARNGVS